jgi:hypothetical protein
MILPQNCHAIREFFVATGVTDGNMLLQWYFLRSISYSALRIHPRRGGLEEGIFTYDSSGAHQLEDKTRNGI